MKTLKYVATLLGLLLMMALCGCYYTSGVGMGESDCTYKNAESYLVGEGTAEKITEIKINWVSGGIQIECGNDKKVSFTEKVASSSELSEEFRMRYLVEGSTLNIQFVKSGRWKIGKLEKTLVVTVPSELLTKVECNGVSADIKMECNAKAVEIDTVSGNSELSGTFGSVRFNSVSGNLNLISKEMTSIKASTVSGSMDATFDRAKTVDFDSVSGSITMKTPMGYTCKLGTMSGTFKGEGKKEGDKVVFGDGALQVEVSTMSGNVTIEK